MRFFNRAIPFILIPTLAQCRLEARSKPLPDLLDATLDDLRAGLDNGDFTSVDLVSAYIARIEEVNAKLHAVTEINPDALAIAAKADETRQACKSASTRNPLHGIPILVKDNIASADGMNNTAGSHALLGAKVPEDSTVIAKLRNAGAIILGKTNMSQWAMYRTMNTSQGWSAYGGQCLGAYIPDQDPAGSSSGSAVASSLGLSWATLGTDTSGSITVPASFNNVVGIRPTVGLTSRYLVIPISVHQDTVGPMAMTVKDAAYLLSAIAGPDSNDNYTSAIPFKQIPNYVSSCHVSGLRGKRLGIPRHLFDINFLPTSDPTSDPVLLAFEASLDILRNAGAELIDNVTLPGVDCLKNDSFQSMIRMADADFLTNLPEYLAKLESNPQNITSLTDLRYFTQNHAEEEYPERNTAYWDRALEQSYNNTAPEFWGNYTWVLQQSGHFGLTGALRNHSLDALILPPMIAWLMAGALGTPIVTVPLGKAPDDAEVIKDETWNLTRFAPNWPFGISFAGDKWTEEALIGMAYAFEQRTLARKTVKPHIQPRTQLNDIIRNAPLLDL